MSKRRIRRSIEPNFPYGKSVVASSGLIVAFMLVLALLADPRSGEITSPVLAYSALGVLPLAIVAVFYTEFRFRNKRHRTGMWRPNREAESSSRTLKKTSVSSRC